MRTTQKESGLLINFMSAQLMHLIKSFSVITLKFHNFDSQGYKQKFTYSLNLQEMGKKGYQKKQKDYPYFNQQFDLKI